MRIGSAWLAAGVLVAGCLLTGCAGTGTGGEPRAAKTPVPPPSATGKAACFQVRDVQDFKVLDRSNLIVYAPNEANAYHVRISPPASALHFAEGLSFLPALGRICGYAGERLIVGPPQSAERFSIIDVSRVSSQSLETLRGSRDGGAAPAAQPQPGPGADIESAPARPAPAKPDGGAER